MNKLLMISLIFINISGCITGNPWQQFLWNIQSFVGTDFESLKSQLKVGGRNEITTNGGYMLPNGNRQHEFSWGGQHNKNCILLIEEDAKTHRVVSVGGKGATTECQWGG